jgi:hypothetical protein
MDLLALAARLHTDERRRRFRHQGNESRRLATPGEEHEDRQANERPAPASDLISHTAPSPRRWWRKARARHALLATPRRPTAVECAINDATTMEQGGGHPPRAIRSISGLNFARISRRVMLRR